MAWPRSSKPALLLVTLLWVSGAVPAELYRYQNEAGVTVVDWAIPAAYVSDGYEVLSESGQVVRVVPPAKTETELERDAAAKQARDAEAAAEAAQLERDTFLLRRYSTIQDIEAARDRSLRELDIRIAILNESGARGAGVVIGLDRCERGDGELSAVQQVEQDWGLKVVSVVSLHDIISWVESNPAMAQHREALERYRQRYGVA